MHKKKFDASRGIANLDSALSQIEKAYGEGAIFLYGEGIHQEKDSISTRCLSIDNATGVGGIPIGGITEIFGAESSGKTTLTLHIIAEAQSRDIKTAFIDAEQALDIDYAKALGVDVDNMLLSQPDYGEQALDIAEKLVESKAVGLIVIDSVAALTPRSEIEGEMGDAQMAAQVRMMSQALRKLTAKVKKSNVCLIFINQTRMKIGVMWGNPETTSGGNALKFYALMRLKISKTGTIKQGEREIANQSKVKVVKSKVSAPFREAKFVIRYGTGIDRLSEIVDLGIDYKIIEKKAGWVQYKGKSKLYKENGKESFRSLLEEKPALANILYKKIAKEMKNGSN